MIAIILVIAELFLFITTKINVWPEMFFLPWLTGKGLMPYRDFFDDHGPLTHYLLAPLTIDKSLILFRLMFIILQLANLALFLLIIKKGKSHLLYFIGGLTYVAVAYFYSENNFWFEIFITFFYLLAYYIVIQKRFKGYIIGTLIALASLVKPTAAIVLLPLYWSIKKFSLLVSFLAVWTVVLLYFYFNHGLSAFIDNLFLYNIFLTRTQQGDYWSFYSYLFRVYKYLWLPTLLMILSILFSLYDKKFKKIILPLGFIISSLSFLAANYARVKLLPAVIFVILLVVTAIPHLKTKRRLTLTLLLIIFLSFMTGKIVQYYFSERNKTVYIEEKTSQSGDNIRLYFINDQLPTTYFPLRYPLIEKYYPESKLIN